jgi:hypothetical protein
MIHICTTNNTSETSLGFLDSTGLHVKMRNGRNIQPCSKIFLYYWRAIQLICLLLVIFQTFLSINDNFYEGKTTTTIKETKLDEEEFPVVFNIVVKPGLDIEKLNKRGYATAHEYFMGSKKSSGITSWAGLGKEKNNVTGNSLL